MVNAEVSTYWQIPPQSEVIDQDRSVRNLRVALQESVRDQLVADVPVGCFLSGGLDTSAIVAFASKAVTQPLKTFCMGFGEETDELRDARLIAEHFGTDHHELIVDSSQGHETISENDLAHGSSEVQSLPMVRLRARQKVCYCLPQRERWRRGLRRICCTISKCLKDPESWSQAPVTFSPSRRCLESISTDMRTRNRFRVLTIVRGLYE